MAEYLQVLRQELRGERLMYQGRYCRAQHLTHGHALCTRSRRGHGLPAHHWGVVGVSAIRTRGTLIVVYGIMNAYSLMRLVSVHTSIDTYGGIGSPWCNSAGVCQGKESPVVKYRVTLTEQERAGLKKMVSAGKGAARKLLHARILL